MKYLYIFITIFSISLFLGSIQAAVSDEVFKACVEECNAARPGGYNCGAECDRTGTFNANGPVIAPHPTQREVLNPDIPIFDWQA